MTRESIGVSSSIKQAKSIYPEVKLILDEMSGEYFIMPDQYQAYKDGEPQVLCLFYVMLDESNHEPEFVASEDGNRFESEINYDGNIYKVLIFNWK